MTSYSLVPTHIFREEFVRNRLAEVFRAELGAVDHYEWRFVSKGSVLVDYDDKPPLLADRDYVEIQAFGK